MVKESETSARGNHASYARAKLCEKKTAAGACMRAGMTHRCRVALRGVLVAGNSEEKG